MTITANGRLRTLRRALQEQIERHTGTLSDLTTHGTDLAHRGLDPETAKALTESTRQALTDTVDALERMVEGTYGRCDRCKLDIPFERLEILPHARFCVPCQQA